MPINLNSTKHHLKKKKVLQTRKMISLSLKQHHKHRFHVSFLFFRFDDVLSTFELNHKSNFTSVISSDDRLRALSSHNSA